MNDIKAYPNPATTFINIPLNGVQGNGNIKHFRYNWKTSSIIKC